MALSLPRSIYPGLQAITQADDESVARLTEALEEVPAAGDPEKLAADVSSHIGEPPIPDLLSVIRALVTLHTGRALHGMDVPSFVTEVCDTLAKAREFSGFTRDDMEKLRDRLERFLRSDGSLAIEVLPLVKTEFRSV